MTITKRMGLAIVLAMAGASTAMSQATGPAEQPAAQGGDSMRDNQKKPPIPGANSFTEEQARQRIEKAGVADVKNLKKDDSGIWRGSGTKDGSPVTVALDYQGNVVAGQPGPGQ